MQLIDRYAYTNKLAKVSPAAKALLALWVIGLCLGLNRPLVGLTALVWMAGLAIGLAGIPGKVFGRVLLAEGSFLLLTSIGVALSVSTEAAGQPWQINLGPLWLSTSPDGLYQMLLLVSRALGAAAALNFLAFTTPLVDIVVLLRRLHVPEALIDVMVVMYRFIFVLLDTLERMMTAQASRLGYQAGYWRSMQNAGQLGARLFVNATERTQVLETAVASRGFEGSLKVLSPDYRSFPQYGLWLAAITVSLVLVRFGALWMG
jgi:cobalt/nickel transport system permease protein